MRLVALAVVLGIGLVAGPAARAGTQLSGGGRKAGDCLTGLEVVGAASRQRARTVGCHDGDAVCDRDGLVNGRCGFWARACLNQGDGCGGGGVTGVSVDTAGGDDDLTMVARTLELVKTPAAESDTCGAMTTLTVALGRRANGSARK